MPWNMVYIMIQKKKLAASNNNTDTVSPSLGGSEIWKWLNWVVVAQCLLCDCSQELGQGCGHQKA